MSRFHAAKLNRRYLGTVANAVTSGLNAYGLSAGKATSFTNQMVTTVGQGKMTMQDLAGSLSAVLPIAAAKPPVVDPPVVDSMLGSVTPRRRARSRLGPLITAIA